MPESHSISKKDARRLAVIHQGLHNARPFGLGKNGFAKMLDQIGYVQIDTISVVERAHHHVAHTRVPNYKKKHLLDLQDRHRQVLEYWAHAAAYIPMTDYRFTIPVQEEFRKGRDGWPQVDSKVKELVKDRIRSEGPLMSRDFERKERSGNGWWDWKPAKLALQRLFFEGELVISHRKSFQRVYDIPDRVLPADVDRSAPTKSEYADFLINRYLKANGLGTAKSMTYLRKGMGATVSGRLSERVEAGELVLVNVSGTRSKYYAKANFGDALSARVMKNMHILSPFDNLVIQRERLSELFDFEYQIECYVPRPKRVHGYFVLPLLLGERMVGRLDAKAERKKNKLNIISLSIESGVGEDAFIEKLIPALKSFAEINGCDEVQVAESSDLGKRLEAELK